MMEIVLLPNHLSHWLQRALLVIIKIILSVITILLIKITTTILVIITTLSLIVQWTITQHITTYRRDMKSVWSYSEILKIIFNNQILEIALIFLTRITNPAIIWMLIPTITLFITWTHKEAVITSIQLEMLTAHKILLCITSMTMSLLEVLILMFLKAL